MPKHCLMPQPEKPAGLKAIQEASSEENPHSGKDLF